MRAMRIKYKMLAPVSHIGEVASTGSYFQTVLTSKGRIPVITGNSMRGQLRDSIALDLLFKLNCKVDKETFNVLFSGGNINGSMKEDVEKAKLVRQHFPCISLLGGGLGDMIMSGKVITGFLYPVCKETEDITDITSDISWHNLIDEIEFTRMNDAKNDEKAVWIIDAGEELKAQASTQMRFSVQYIAAGTEFVQEIIFTPTITDLELGAFFAGLLKWFEMPKLGGMSAKGFGSFDAVVGENDIVLSKGNVIMSDEVKRLVNEYDCFANDEGAEWLYLLSTAKGGKKNGKKADSAS